MRHNGERRPEEIQADIERTRGDMHATLSAIEQRLTPGQLIDQSLDYLRNSGAREFTSNLGNSVKNNPVPVALMGIGMAWLMITGNRKPAYAYPASEYEGSGSMMARASEGMSSARDRASGSAQSAKDSVSQTAQSARERLSQTAQSARERLSSASQRVGQVGQSARDQVYRVREGYDTMVREQPLALGAIGLAIGALLASVAPRTRQEDQLMGEASDRLTEKAKEVGKEQVGKAQQVATAAKDAALGEAEKQGMSPKGGHGADAGQQRASQAPSQPAPQPGAWTSASAPQSGSPTGPQSGLPTGPQSGSQTSKPSGRPNVIEPARATPMSESVVSKDPRAGKPGGRS